MASLRNDPKGTPESQHHNVLFLGTVAVASAFLVTLFIALLCVGCKRKDKTKKVQIDGVKLVEMSLLRQTKLRSISKSDTKLHELSRIAGNGKKGSRSRPASMDLLFLPNRKSDWDLRCPQNRQLPKIPLSPGGDKEHTYSEVKRPASQPRCTEDALYESVGGRHEDEVAPPSSQPKQPVLSLGNNHVESALHQSQEVNRSSEDAVTAEYACVRKVRKLEKQQHLETSPDPVEPGLRFTSAEDYLNQQERDNKKQTIKEPILSHSFPKDSGFMGNGEQYIWKPPEEEEEGLSVSTGRIGMPNVSSGDLNHGPAVSVEISDMYSKVCKPSKKKRPPASPPAPFKQGAQDVKPLSQSRPCGGPKENKRFEAVQPPSWPGGGAQAMKSTEDPCYESINEKMWSVNEEADPAYESIDANWKRDKPPMPPLSKNKKKVPTKGCLNENFYETISDAKQGSTSTTTVFMFNDGIEMYVTGL
ncbi:uncharacterized protein LOC114659300 isoform X1 [Erpetoichthys calabaricus]|uniref:Uncharacterized LOC114659300 n=1 Tax=Erpetoichthys calabaricus TaxID=27687 RepID=A0A8C4S749_ERPCA|nr:uncharacterized protein LOC114659300 isoform X1 [Erpetoichthys calabaricus]XP_051788824.1 uncharacterized protein LOC114659300 isoform X1 [Erpetoichthys calabaricus]XP_051788825.1 uncharacterized protein LOC114659300 isoform X1 [Erpetoichthys calabaricus]